MIFLRRLGATVSAAAWTALMLAGAARAGNPLPNPGFEDGPSSWMLDDGMSVVTNAAACTGALGLRVADDSPTDGSSASSARLPVAAGAEVILSFKARAPKAFLGVYLQFQSADGRAVRDAGVRDAWGVRGCTVDRADGAWHDYELRAVAPTGAASVVVWVHSWSSATGTADLDDFALAGLADDARPLAAPPRARPVRAPAPPPAVLPPRAAPPAVVLKLDDFRPAGRVAACWVRLADSFARRNIKGGFGVVCAKLAEAGPECTDWMKARQAEGRVEFWFHGWDHGTHEADGATWNEFNRRPFEEQKARFDRSQALALEKLGFAFRTFGPPGGVGTPSFDAATACAMAADPHMTAWLYPQPADDVARALEAEGKVTVLDRVFEANIERSVGLPDFDRFAAGYARHPDRAYFVLQGHPPMWGAEGERWTQFERIVDFLVAQKAEFLTPSELAARVRASRTAGSGAGGRP